MSDRREFKRAVKVAIIKRSMIDGVPMCEAIEPDGKRCLCQKGLECHHDDMDAMESDKSRPLTDDDGRMLCPKHHDPITKKQVGALSKARRQEAAHLGAEKPHKAKIAQPPKAPRSNDKVAQIAALRAARPNSLGGFRPIGKVAADVLAKLNPKKAAE